MTDPIPFIKALVTAFSAISAGVLFAYALAQPLPAADQPGGSEAISAGIWGASHE